MCYSNSSTSSNETLRQRYKRSVQLLPPETPVYYANGFSFPTWRIITKAPTITLMKWGLIPHWYRGNTPLDFASKTLNARIETLHEKASFKPLTATHRCVVPSSGFFEFKHLNAVKIPYFIYPKEQSIFSMAGLYDEWFNPETKEYLRCFTIITAAANPLMEEIHNSKKRMPLIIPNHQVEQYLNGTDKIQHFSPIPPEEMNAHPIAKGIISSQHANVPAVQQPIVNNIEEQTRLF